MHPGPDEERPRKRDDSPDACNSDEAISRNATVRLDEIVETDRWRLHKAKGHHRKTNLQAHPAFWRRILRYEAEDKCTERGNEESRQCGDETRFRLGETVVIFLRQALSRPICNKVRVDLSYSC
jgi:hypothetical protein